MRMRKLTALTDIPEDSAREIVRTLPAAEAETKWNRALAVWHFDLARDCFEHGNDLNALMLLLLATGNRIRLSKLAGEAEAKGRSDKRRRVR